MAGLLVVFSNSHLLGGKIMSTTFTTPTTITSPADPHVFLICGHCHSTGHHVGDWVAARLATDITAEDLHEATEIPATPECDGVVIYDVDDPRLPPVRSVEDAVDCGKAYEDLDAQDFDAWCALGRLSGEVTPVTTFANRYYGEWETFHEFARDRVNDSGVLDGTNDTLRRYFDYDKWTRDLAHDYEIVDTGRDTVFVFGL